MNKVCQTRQAHNLYAVRFNKQAHFFDAKALPLSFLMLINGLSLTILGYFVPYTFLFTFLYSYCLSIFSFFLFFAPCPIEYEKILTDLFDP